MHHLAAPTSHCQWPLKARIYAHQFACPFAVRYLQIASRISVMCTCHVREQLDTYAVTFSRSARCPLHLPCWIWQFLCRRVLLRRHGDKRTPVNSTKSGRILPCRSRVDYITLEDQSWQQPLYAAGIQTTANFFISYFLLVRPNCLPSNKDL